MRKGEEERKRLMGKEAHVERYMPRKSAPLLRLWPETLYLAISSAQSFFPH